MKVSVLWLGLFLVTIVLVWATVQGYFLHESFKGSQGSQDSKVAEGFSGTSEDIRVSGCPSSTTTFINSKGHTICCDGPIVDGKCSGREVCSLSQGANLPTCSEYKTAWLDEKGAKKCPRALPNYFENPSGVGGCTSGPRNQDGSAPENPSDPKCMLYTDADSEIKKKDSCLNQKHFEDAPCFNRMGINVTKEMFETGWGPTIVYCTYTAPGNSFPQACYPDTSLYRYFKYFTDRGQWTQWKDWFTGSNYTNQIYFCSKAQRVNVDKTIPLDALKQESV